MDMHSINPIAVWPVTVLVLAATVTDLRSRRIPNSLVLPFLIVGILSAVMAHGWSGLGQSVMGVLLAVAALGVFCVLGGMGMGDLKLGAAVGAWIGPSQLLIALVMTSLAGGVMALGWALYGGFLREVLRSTVGLVIDRERRKTLTLANPAARKMPYAPAIALGTILSFLGR
jgi:prepilin peptidase CpaA